MMDRESCRNHRLGASLMPLQCLCHRFSGLDAGGGLGDFRPFCKPDPEKADSNCGQGKAPSCTQTTLSMHGWLMSLHRIDAILLEQRLTAVTIGYRLYERIGEIRDFRMSRCAKVRLGRSPLLDRRCSS